MPRPEAPIPDSSSPVGEFAASLRALRKEAGVSYRQMEDSAHFSYSTFSKAAAGQTLPTRDVLVAYVRACGATDDDQAFWLARWSLVRKQMREQAHVDELFNNKRKRKPKRLRPELDTNVQLRADSSNGPASAATGSVANPLGPEAAPAPVLASSSDSTNRIGDYNISFVSEHNKKYAITTMLSLFASILAISLALYTYTLDRHQNSEGTSPTPLRGVELLDVGMFAPASPGGPHKSAYDATNPNSVDVELIRVTPKISWPSNTENAGKCPTYPITLGEGGPLPRRISGNSSIRLTFYIAIPENTSQECKESFAVTFETVTASTQESSTQTPSP
jgi:transcriptional regulator with XRE-family HTH domain